MLDYLVIGVVAVAAVALALFHHFSARVQSFDALVKFILALGAAFIAVTLVPHFNEPPPEPTAYESLSEAVLDPSPDKTVSEEPPSEEARLEEMATASAAEVAEEIRNANDLAARARAAGGEEAGSAVLDEEELVPTTAMDRLLGDPALPNHGTAGGQSAMDWSLNMSARATASNLFRESGSGHVSAIRWM